MQRQRQHHTEEPLVGRLVGNDCVRHGSYLQGTQKRRQRGNAPTGVKGHETGLNWPRLAYMGEKWGLDKLYKCS